MPTSRPCTEDQKRLDTGSSGASNGVRAGRGLLAGNAESAHGLPRHQVWQSSCLAHSCNLTQKQRTIQNNAGGKGRRLWSREELFLAKVPERIPSQCHPDSVSLQGKRLSPSAGPDTGVGGGGWRVGGVARLEGPAILTSSACNSLPKVRMAFFIASQQRGPLTGPGLSCSH